MTLFARKMGVDTMRAYMGPGTQNPTKRLVHLVEFWGRSLSRKSVFLIFRARNTS